MTRRKPVAFAEENLERAIREEMSSQRDAATGTPSRYRRTGNRSKVTSDSYHEARVLLLVAASQKSGIKGLTKLAKLDFLLRYPVFLEELVERDDPDRAALPAELWATTDEELAVESRMVRYKYGPWDDRYYGILGNLIGRGLITADREGNVQVFRPTRAGEIVAESLARDPSWSLTAKRAAYLCSVFRRTTGNRLKQMIYEKLPDVVDRPHRAEI